MKRPIFFWLLANLALCKGQHYFFSVEHGMNPYSNFTSQRLVPPEHLLTSADTSRSYARRSPQWVNVNNHHVLVGTGSNLTAGRSRREQFELLQSQQPELDQQQQQPQSYYSCDSIIRDERFVIESPNYPAEYPLNRLCTYYIAKNRSDVCQIEVTISDMDIEDTPRCTADYLDLGGGQDERLCGLMLRNTRRLIVFPANDTYIRIAFRSDNRNGRPYRGFSAEVQQLPNSCYTVLYANGTSPITPGITGSIYPSSMPRQIPQYGQRLYPPSVPYYPQRPDPRSGLVPQPPFTPQQPYNPSTSIFTPQQPYVPPIQPTSTYLPYNPVQPSTSYTPQPYNPQLPSTSFIPQPYNPLQPSTPIAPGQPYKPFNPLQPSTPYLPGQVYNPLQPSTPYLPGQSYNQLQPTTPYNSLQPSVPYMPGQPYMPATPPYAMQPGQTFNPTSQNQSTIYLASYCDVFLGEYTGDIRSPGYPFGYPTNHSCIYTIKKASPDVCQLELVFHHFDIQTPNAQKDLTENCSGDYVEMPDHSRLCGFYTQSMSKEHRLKKYYMFYDSSEYLFLHFYSDTQQMPDGSGFWIEVRQLRNSCSSSYNSQKAKCDKVINGQVSTVDRIYSPNYPQLYEPRQQCVYFVVPADATTCEFEVDLVTFNLEDSGKDFSDDPQQRAKCVKDFFQLPDRKRICGHVIFRRMYQFPKYHNRISMLYFHSDDQIEDKGYEIVVRQLPNTCNNTVGNNQNVYTISDPNLPFNPPTPVFTFNNASGLQPLNPSLPPNAFNFRSSASVPGRKSTAFASQLPGFLNDPRNVDSSGTIPLYFANGSLATRIPPLKPVDMIPFLKKGKTFVQKGSTGLDGKSVFAAIKSPLELNHILSNRFPESSLFGSKIQPSVISPRSDRLIDPASSMQLLPSYGCDQTVTREIEYIRSPNFPSNYPPVTRCIYSINKAANSVCQVRLHILTLDLEYTAGCKNDYLQIETTGEKLCGRSSQPETKVINFFGHSREMRLIFNSDRQATASGFEVRVEQVQNSCHPTSPSPNLNSMLNRISPRSNQRETETPLMSSSSMTSTTRAGTLMTFGSSPEAQALTVNQSFTTPTTPAQMKICRTTSMVESFFESDNFPMPYPTNTDCQYKVFRANRNVCRLEVEFVEFQVGNEEISNQFNDNVERPEESKCLNDYLEIDYVRYCGFKAGKMVPINFGRSLAEISFRFVSTPQGSHSNGFRIKVKQIDQNCHSTSRVASGVFASELNDEFTPPIIESCPKQSNRTTDPPQSLIQEKLVKIQSPEFGLTSTIQYKPFLDCDYTIQKYSRDVCAVEVRFESFSLEESRGCNKDYLDINNEMRLCGKLPSDAARTLNFPTNTFRIHFHTDGDNNDSGFVIRVKQIRC